MKPVLLGGVLIAVAAAAWKVKGPQSDPYPYDSGDHRPADVVLREAADRATRESKQVFVVISSSWCGPCKIFWRHIHVPEVWSVLDRNYVVVKLDTYEQSEKKDIENSGTDVLATKWAGVQPTIPYYAVLSSKLEYLADSMDHAYKSKPLPNYAGITSRRGDQLRAVLKKTVKHLKPNDLKDLEYFMAHYEG